MKTFIIILAVFLMLTTICYGAFTDKPGARPIGLGGAYVAIADDINSLFYNPAGLGRLYRTEITGVYDQQSVGLGVNLNYGYIGAIQPAGDLGIFGASVSQSYSELYREYIISLSYGTKITKKPLVYAGGNIKSLSKKYIENSYTQIDPLFLNNGYSKTGISFDIGILAYK